MSALSAIAEYPERIYKLFEEETEPNQYAVNVTKNGEKRRVVVDNYIPCIKGRPVFTKGNGNELWVLVLEKAWAKIHGTYKRCE